MGLIARIRERRADARAEAAAERYAAIEQDVAEARAEQAEQREWAQGVARGIYRDAAGSYVFSAPRLLEIAQRCGSRAVDPRQVESLLRVATQIAMTADGVPLRVDRLTAADIDRRPALRLVGPEVA